VLTLVTPCDGAASDHGTRNARDDGLVSQSVSRAGSRDVHRDGVVIIGAY